MKKICCIAIAMMMLASLLLSASAADTQPAIDYVKENAYMVGTGNGFEPDAPVTRAMACQIIYNIEGRPTPSATESFTDVSGGWYADAAIWAKQAGLVTGTAFHADAVISGPEFTSMLRKYAQSIEKTLAGSEKISGKNVSRSQAAQFLYDNAPWGEKPSIPAEGGAIFISPYEWGPGVSKVIVSLSEPVEAVNASGASIITSGVERPVLSAYLSDKSGEPVKDSSSYVAFDLKTGQEDGSSPFTYNMENSLNEWSSSYLVTARFSVSKNDTKYAVFIEKDCIQNRICPASEQFDTRGSLSGSYQNPMTGKSEEMTLHYAAYQPAALGKDSQKNPLIIWLHGQGEGGTDPDIALLGNKVTALAEEPIQSYFTTKDGATGTYVLTVQCPTYWMDGGDGTNSNGDVVSRYTEILMDTIKKYVSQNSDVDEARIYLGGCSNGGYMTMNMLVSYPEYWAAAYPICEAYAYNVYRRDADGNYVVSEGTDFFTLAALSDELWMTSDKIQRIKDVPIWFIHAANDPLVVPARTSMPTYQALLKAGAKNCWYSLFETIEGKDDPDTEYFGHFSWLYLFNNQVTGVQDSDAIMNSKDLETYGFTAVNKGGGLKTASDENGQYTNIFEWMNAQKKQTGNK